MGFTRFICILSVGFSVIIGSNAHGRPAPGPFDSLESLSQAAFSKFRAMSANRADIQTKTNVRALLSVPATTTGVYCQLKAGAPDYLPWVISSADVRGDYVVLSYKIPGNVTVNPMIPRTVIFAYHLSGNYAPWYVYFGSEEISSEVRINEFGTVAFWRTQNVQAATSTTPAVTMKRDELRVCPINPAQMNSAVLAYPCASNIFQGTLVESILYDQPTMISPTGGSNGKIMSFEWSQDRLVYTSRTLSDPAALNPYSSLKVWHQNMTQPSVLHSVSIFGSGNSSINGFYVDTVDSAGNIGFTRRTMNVAGFFQFTVESEALSIERLPNGSYGQPVSFSLAPTGPGATAVVYWWSSGFARFGSELHRIFRDVAVSTQAWNFRSSEDNYQTDNPLIPIPSGRTLLARPRRVPSVAFGELLVMESTGYITGTSTPNRFLEVYSYQPSGVPGVVGTYQHMETILPTPPFASLGLLETGGGFNDQIRGSFVGLHTDSNWGRVLTYFECI